MIQQTEQEKKQLKLAKELHSELKKNSEKYKKSKQELIAMFASYKYPKFNLVFNMSIHK